MNHAPEGAESASDAGRKTRADEPARPPGAAVTRAATVASSEEPAVRAGKRKPVPSQTSAAPATVAPSSDKPAADRSSRAPSRSVARVFTTYLLPKGAGR